MTTDTVRLGLIGSGWMGAFHAQTIARRVPGATLAAVADPQPGAAERVAHPLGTERVFLDPLQLIADEEIDGVVIASPASSHTDLVVAAADAGKAAFVEKPMALTLHDADRAIGAASDAGVRLQVGFNRRFARDFAAAQEVVRSGGVGTPQLLRSVTRDPGLANPGSVKPWTIFLETLIHDFDALNWFNAGARPIEVYAAADALVAPEFKEAGLLDTAVVTIRYDNGAIATAEANFSAAYGYDVRGEVFGSAGMVTAGDVHASSMRQYTSAGVQSPTSRRNIDLFHDAYVDELRAFADATRALPTETGRQALVPTGHDARAALSIALACIASVEQRSPITLE